jgi:hypothetical protein
MVPESQGISSGYAEAEFLAFFPLLQYILLEIYSQV